MSDTIIVLFNLKEDSSIEAYEAWARDTDLPTVRGLGSIDSFRLFKAQGLLMSEDTPPYEYIEVIEVADMEQFGSDVSSATMQKIASEFQSFADNPLFLHTAELFGR